MKQIIDYTNGTDTGEADSQATSPIANGENFDAAVLGRPTGNLRNRTEVLRVAANQAAYVQDADRGLMAFVGPASGTVTSVWDAGENSGYLMASDYIVIMPMITPGASRGYPGDGAGAYASRRAVYTMWSNGTQAVSDSGLRILSELWAFEGANDITISVTVDASVSGSPVVAVTGDATVPDSAWQPSRDNITVRINAAHTYADIVTALTASPAASALVSCAWVAGDVGGGADTDTFHGSDSGQLAGGLDGENHTISAEELAAFFAASDKNLLRPGDTLAIYYASLSDRRRATKDIPALSGSYADIPAASLANLTREPEKAMYAVPVGKMLPEGTFMFVGGWTISANVEHYAEDTASYLRSLLSSAVGTAYITHTPASGGSSNLYNYLRNFVEPTITQNNLQGSNRRFVAGDKGSNGSFYYVDSPTRVAVTAFTASARSTDTGADVRRTQAAVQIQGGVGGATALTAATLYYVYSTASGAAALTSPVTASTGDVLLGWLTTPATLGAFQPATNHVMIDYTVNGPKRKGLIAYSKPISAASTTDPLTLWITPGYVWVGGEVFYVAQTTQIKADLSATGDWAPGSGIVAGQYGFLYAQVFPNASSSTRSIAQPITSWRLDTVAPDADGMYGGWPCIAVVRCSGISTAYLNASASYPDGSVVHLNPGGNPFLTLPRLSSAVSDFSLLAGESLTDVNVMIQGGSGGLTLAMPYSTSQPFTTPGEASPSRYHCAWQDSNTVIPGPVFRVDLAASSVTGVFVQSFRYTRVYGSTPNRW